ncbi:MAG: hypothetical protein EOP50_05715, partial [Sphingobacteriales bacterium]
MHKNDIYFLLDYLDELVHQALQLERQHNKKIALVHPAFRHSARNLLYYLALRDNDLRPLQFRLSCLGLSSLGRAEAHTLPNLLSIRHHVLQLLTTADNSPLPILCERFRHLNGLLGRHVHDLFGPGTPLHAGHIMVTLDAAMLSDQNALSSLLNAGMTCARINCAHDDQHIWLQLIKAVRKASADTKIPCKVFMDLGGPKIRTGELQKRPKLVQLRPQLSDDGRLEAPASIWLFPDDINPPETTDYTLPMPFDWLQGLELNQKIRFKDIRGRKRTLRVHERVGNCVLVHLKKNAVVSSGTVMQYAQGRDANLQSAAVGVLPDEEIPILLYQNDLLILHGRNEPGRGAKPHTESRNAEPAQVACTLPEVLEDIQPGHRVLLNDGKIEAKVLKASPGELTLRITYAKAKGSKLRSEKGINFPDSELRLPGLTDKDREDLAFVARYADVVNMSFVNTPDDVYDLYRELNKLGAHRLGVLLKIETKRAFENMPRLLLALMQRYPAGMMIARGDMAVEVGWNRLAEVQEVLRRHGLQDVDLVDQDALDHVHPGEQVPAEPQVAAAAGRLGRHQCVPDGHRLVQQLLEPELVDLVDGDEQQLVVGRRVRLEVLRVEQLRQAQVAAVGQQRALLTETDEVLRRGVHGANLGADAPIPHDVFHETPSPAGLRRRSDRSPRD